MKNLLLVISVLGTTMFMGCDKGETQTSSANSQASTAPAQKTYVIGISQPNLGEPWRVQMQADLKAAAEKHSNIQAIFKDAQNDSLTQRSQVEEYISQKVDLIIISPKEAQPLTEPV